MDIATKLKELRCAKGLSQRELAKALNITGSAVSGYELGTRVPSLEGLTEIAQFFGVSIDYLAGNTEYYSDVQAAELIQEYYERPELKILFDAARNVSKDDVLQIAAILEKMAND